LKLSSCDGVEDQVGIACSLNAHRKSFAGFLKLKAPGSYLHNLAEAGLTAMASGFGVNNPSFIEKDCAGLLRICEHEFARELCVFDYLHGVEGADSRQVSGKRDERAS
jgi:hypothetical protein